MFDLGESVEDYANKKRDEALKKVYNMIERRMAYVGKSDDTPLSVLQDIRHEVGLLRSNYDITEDW